MEFRLFSDLICWLARALRQPAPSFGRDGVEGGHTGLQREGVGQGHHLGRLGVEVEDLIGDDAGHSHHQQDGKQTHPNICHGESSFCYFFKILINCQKVK